MARRGPKPKPAATKRREGNPGHRPIREGFHGHGLPEKPAFLTAEAEAEWDRTVPQLIDSGVVTAPHTGALTAMCVFWGVAEAARKEYERAGIVEEGSMGQMVESPLLRSYHNAIAAYMRIAVEFGMTASAAMRIEQAKGEPIPFADIGPSPRLRAVK